MSTFLTYFWLRSVTSRSDETGQATAEYALVLLGAASIALVLVAWAAHSGKIGELFDTVFDHVIHQVA